MWVKALFGPSRYTVIEFPDDLRARDIDWALNSQYGGFVNWYGSPSKKDAEAYVFAEEKELNDIPVRDPVEYCETNYPEMCTEFKKWQQEQYRLLCKKQMDYGPLNISMGTQLKNIDEIRASLLGIVVRANDKMQRLVNLIVVRREEPQNESVEDTFMDLAVYATIAMTVKSGKWGR